MSHSRKITLIYIYFPEPTNMLDMKAIIWLENYLQVNHYTIHSI